MARTGRPKGPQPSLRSQWLGEKLRDLRKDRGISQDDAAEYIQRTSPMLSRYESGEYPIRRGDVLALMDLYGVSVEETRRGLLQLCDDIWRKDWWDPYSEDVTRDFINVPWLESRADEILVYENMVIHGLLQTRAYAETLIRNAERDSADEEAYRWLNLRMERQKILAEGTDLAVIIEEHVLHRPVGSEATRREQLEQLLSVSQQDNISVRIMPISHGPHAAHAGGFVLYEMSEPYSNVAHVETVAGSLYVEEPAVRHLQDVWEDLDRGALTQDESSALIAAALEGNKQ
ncbi:helix-turn-helix transcriptional regulator [Glycomyces albus]